MGPTCLCVSVSAFLIVLLGIRVHRVCVFRRSQSPLCSRVRKYSNIHPTFSSLSLSELAINTIY